MQLDKIFRTALEYNASDVYITTGSRPVVRIHGDLMTIDEHPIVSADIARQYIFEAMTPEQQKEFDAKKDIDFAIDIAGIARFRVNVFMQKNGMGAVFRLIPSKVKTMDELQLPASLRKILTMKNGIVLVTGPTGSGKSTTLASILNEINTNQRQHIITIEDPIEFVHENKLSFVEQREVGVHTQSFSNALRASLREDPNVLLIGEMRDLETMSLAITAAETGHLVLTTLHTSGAAKAIDRVIDAFPPEQQNQIRVQFSESLRCVVWQNLIKTSDQKDRVAAFEILFNNRAIANLIRKNKTFQMQSALETGLSEGMQTMERAVNDLITQGIITPEAGKEFIPEKIEV